ncbi:MAG: hypothetical protein LBL95_00300 [Deltaproteobacteria bacterium]|nr:hypothetical protein [Deltaproteobacteria bacterium]
MRQIGLRARSMASDGTMSPRELAFVGGRPGLAVLARRGHDTDGWLIGFGVAVEEPGSPVICGTRPGARGRPTLEAAKGSMVGASGGRASVWPGSVLK